MLRFVVVVAIMMFVSSAHASWFQRSLERALQNAGDRAINEAVDGAYDAGKQGMKESVKDNGEQETNRAPASKSSPKTTEPSERSSAPVSGDTKSSVSGGQDLVAAEEIYNKYDFIPGDRIIFFDDFSDTDVGEFPRKWTLKGPGGGGNTVEVVEVKGKRFLRSVPSSSRDEGLPSSALYVRLNKKGDMPEKFTIEFDAVLGETGGYPNQYYLLLYDEEGYPPHMPGAIYISGQQAQSMNTNTPVNMNDGKIHRIAVSVNGTFVKAYVDEQRVVNDPDAINRPLKHIGIYLFANWGYSDTVMFTNFRIAEGGKDIKSALDTDGKIVTHGILFDTGSDRIKPESLPTLKMILKLLQDNASLKFSIEGHTDNQGGVSVNQPLSEKRARAVKTWLEAKGIAADRLTAKGWGQDKPIDSNGTAEGRANNRRVEFIRIK